MGLNNRGPTNPNAADRGEGLIYHTFSERLANSKSISNSRMSPVTQLTAIHSTRPTS